jgi:HSP20 family protein
MPFSSKKTKKQRRHRSRESNDSDRTLRPKLNDFKRRTAGEDQSKESATNARNTRDMTKRGGLGEKARALRTRRVNSIFDNFRNSIESMLDPSFSWRYFPSSSRLEMEEEVRTPVYDMVDDGDRYKLIVELPGIEKNNIHISAMDDSIEISAEQSEEEDKQKRNFVYNQRTYTSFYCTVPFPEQILSSQVTAKADNNGILRVELPKKMPAEPQGIKGRSITVQ